MSRLGLGVIDTSGLKIAAAKSFKEWQRVVIDAELGFRKLQKTARQFSVGQTVYYISERGQIWDALVNSVSEGKLMLTTLNGVALGWYSTENVFLDLTEVNKYLDQNKDALACQSPVAVVPNHRTYKIGQVAYIVTRDENKIQILQGTVVDMGEYEAHIKVNGCPARRCVFNPSDVFHTIEEAISASDEILANG